MTIPERAAQIAVQIANDDRHGYSQANRYGTLEGGDFDCSSLVIYCYDRAFMEFGIAPIPKTAGASYTGNMLAGFTRCGFKSFRDDHGSGLQVGDVLLNEARHTAIVCSVNPVKVVNARGDIDGVAGDSTGTEIRIQPYWSYPWDWVLRYEPKESEHESVTESNTVGQQMADKVSGTVTLTIHRPVLDMDADKYSDDVKLMQTLLIFHKYSCGRCGADGYFGNDTYLALYKMQKDHAKVTGRCDRDSWIYLEGTKQ